MGFFRKNNNDAERIEELKAELDLLRRRLDEADAAKARLEERVAETVSRSQLDAKVGSIEAISQRLTTQADDVDALSSQVHELTERLDAPPATPPPPQPHAPPPPPPADAGARVDERVEEIEQRLADLDAVNERLDALSVAVSRQAHDALANDEAIDPAQLSDMANRLEDLSVAVATHTTQLAATRERVDAIEPAGEPAADETRGIVDEMRKQLGQMAERMTSLDRRLTNVSTELANQLTELSRDIDTIAERPAPTLPPPATIALDTAQLDTAQLDTAQLDTDELELRLAEKFDMAIDDVRESQQRLAAEQARYEIKFREDLAELAERIRRPRID